MEGSAAYLEIQRILFQELADHDVIGRVGNRIERPFCNQGFRVARPACQVPYELCRVELSFSEEVEVLSLAHRARLSLVL